MSLSITLHTAGDLPALQALERWLTEQGEPHETEQDQLRLLALPLTIAPVDQQNMRVDVALRCETPVTRAVDLVFDLSVLAGADVRVGPKDCSRAGLWLLLADEQDRMRLAAAIQLAIERGNADEVLRRLWAVLNSLYPRHDVRWSAEQQAIVRLDEVGAPGGIPLEDAEAHELGDLVARRLDGAPHLLAWRWMSEAYPSLSEA